MTSSYELSKRICKRPRCGGKALFGKGLCKKHHIERIRMDKAKKMLHLLGGK